MNPTILPQQKEYNTNNLLQLKEHDLPKKKGCNMKQNYEMGRIPSLSSSCVTRGSIGQQCRLSQSGRSMVEMLGVLAIIGVLSVGGIMGYSYGMDKWRANTTINDINLRTVDLISQLNRGGEPNLSAEWGDIGTAGYPITLNTSYAPNEYFITVENIPSKVCEIIMDTMPQTVHIWVNNAETDEENICNENELNDMDFSLGNDFKGSGCIASADCPETMPVCNPEGQCEPYPDDDVCGGCPEDKPFCDAVQKACGDCRYDSDCGNGELCLDWGKGSCGDKSGYHVCKSYSAGDSVTIDGVTYTQVLINVTDYVNYWDAIKVCGKWGKRLPTIAEFNTVTADGKRVREKLAAQFGSVWAWSSTPTDSPAATKTIVLSSGAQNGGCKDHSRYASLALCRP